jgi:hypothetical protein
MKVDRYDARNTKLGGTHGMQDHIDSEVLDRAARVGVSLWPVVLVVLAATARFMMLPPRQNLATWFRALVTSMLAGLSAHLFAREYGLSENMWAMSIIIASFLADDILRGVLVVGTAFSKNPSVIFDWVDRLRGRKD